MKLKTLHYQRGAGWSQPLAEMGGLDSESTWVTVFADPGFVDDLTPLSDLRATFAKSIVVGCSTAGEIYGSHVYGDGIVVSIARMERASVAREDAEIASSSDSHEAGQSMMRRLASRPGLKSVFILSEGSTVNGSEMVRGAVSAAPSGVVITGGLAGDGDRFKRTWILDGAGKPRERAASAVGVYGDSVQVAFGSMGGWDIFGPERKITRSSGNVLYELDGKPALDLYKTYLGERASGLPATALLFPLSVKANRQSKTSLVRTVLGVDEKEKSMIFAGDLPGGGVAQLMKANLDRLVEGAAGAASMLSNLDPKLPILSLAISCVGRRLVLGPRIEDEVEAALELLPASTQQVGFYSYGEICPWGLGTCELHNQTMTLTGIQEKL